jgi:hypothetical protein
MIKNSLCAFVGDWCFCKMELVTTQAFLKEVKYLSRFMVSKIVLLVFYAENDPRADFSKTSVGKQKYNYNYKNYIYGCQYKGNTLVELLRVRLKTPALREYNFNTTF